MLSPDPWPPRPTHPRSLRDEPWPHGDLIGEAAANFPDAPPPQRPMDTVPGPIQVIGKATVGFLGPERFHYRAIVDI